MGLQGEVVKEKSNRKQFLLADFGVFVLSFMVLCDPSQGIFLFLPAWANK